MPTSVRELRVFPILAVFLALYVLGSLGQAVRADILATRDVLPPSGRIRSSGATPVSVFAGTTGKTTLLAGAALVNRDAVTHTVTFLSSGGTVLREFDLATSPAGALLDEVQNIQSLPGEGISMSIDAAGVTTSVTCTAQATTR